MGTPLSVPDRFLDFPSDPRYRENPHFGLHVANLGTKSQVGITY